MADIVGMGALNEDIIYTVKPGKEGELTKKMKKEARVHVEKHEDYHHLLDMKLKCAGGSAANTITDLSMKGWKCSFIGELGNDETGKFVEDELKSYKIKLITTKTGGVTGSCGIIVHDDGKYSVLFKEGASDDIKISDEMLAEVRTCKLFHSSPFASFKSLESLKTQAALAKEAKKSGVVVSVSPGRLYTEVIAHDRNSEKGKLIEDLLKNSEIMFINQNENFFLSNERGYEKASMKILEEFKSKIICITLGKLGCYVRTRKEGFLIPAHSTNVVSTLGAGDAFAAGFLDAYLKNKTVKECAKEGNWFASICVQHTNPKNYLRKIRT